MSSNVVPFIPTQYHYPPQETQLRLTDQQRSDEEIFKRTLYVGNLHKNTTENVLRALFAVIGTVVDIKMITHDSQLTPGSYCFITYESHLQAQTALAAMNGREVHRMALKVNWATRPDGIKRDTSRDHHIFVGDLAQDITTTDLKKHFDQFGEISEARVVRDAQTNRSKGYGFVAFVEKSDAQNAIHEMNNKQIGGREVRTNWATSRKAPPSPICDPKVIAKATSEYNTTVYVGGIQKDAHSQQLLFETFARFGPVEEVRLFESFGFVKMQTHQAATNAICEMNGASISGTTVKCRWGKDDNKPGESGQHTQRDQTSNSTPVTHVTSWNPAIHQQSPRVRLVQPYHYPTNGYQHQIPRQTFHVPSMPHMQHMNWQSGYPSPYYAYQQQVHPVSDGNENRNGDVPPE